MTVSLSYEKRLETAAQIVWRSRMMFEMHCVLGREKQFKAIKDVLEDYPWFFMLQPHANRFAAFVYLAGMLTADSPKAPPSKRTINLRDLVSEAVSNSLIGDKASRTLVATLNKHTNAQRGVKRIRNKALSHRDASVTLNKAFKEANVTPKELRVLWDDALFVANELRRASSMNELVFNIKDLHRDARRLFTRLGATFAPERSQSVLDELFDGR
ncbi:MAG: hypothetical protein K2X34_13690 [Hyphomonadaceae bacterium]|nr:hypothetical protein [Hyphomonadaceae bacterium]